MLDLGKTETEMRSGVTPGISGVTPQRFRRYAVEISALPQVKSFGFRERADFTHVFVEWSSSPYLIVW